MNKGYIFRLLILVVYGIAFWGCEMYNDDKISPLREGLNKVTVGQIELLVDSKQTNDFGYLCIPTNSRPLITAYIDNSQGGEITIGPVGFEPYPVQISRSILPLASITQSDSDIVQVALEPASPDKEHTDFVLTFTPSNKNSETNQQHSINIRYNTPPCRPLGVGVDSDGNFQPLTYETWEVISKTGDNTKDGYIFWAWPVGMTLHAGISEKAPNCVASFVLNGRSYTPQECATNLTITADDGTVYDLYKLQVGSNQIVDLYAKDVESVRSPSLFSCVNPTILTLNAQAGTFEENMSEDLEISFPSDSECEFSDLPVPHREGYVFGGWTLENEETPIVFPITLETDMVLYALWQDVATVGEVRNLQALFNFENNIIDVTWKSPYVFDVSQIKLTLLGKEEKTENIIEAQHNNFIFDNIEKNTGDYTVLVQLIDSLGEISNGFSTNVSTSEDSYDEVGNLQATVLTDRIDFRWTSPPKEDISHIELTWENDELLSENVLEIDGEERFISFELVEEFPKTFAFRTVDGEGTSSEGVLMYTVALELDGNLETVDKHLVVPADSLVADAFNTVGVPVREGFQFVDWFTDSSFESKFDSVSVTDPLHLYSKWIEIKTPDSTPKEEKTQVDGEEDTGDIVESKSDLADSGEGKTQVDGEEDTGDIVESKSDLADSREGKTQVDGEEDTGDIVESKSDLADSGEEKILADGEENIVDIVENNDLASSETEISTTENHETKILVEEDRLDSVEDNMVASDELVTLEVTD